MKIVLCSHEFPPENGWGGIATYTYYMAQGLSKKGHDVTVIAGAVDGAALFSERNGIKIIRFRSFNTHYYLSRLGVKNKTLIRFLSRLDSQIALGFQISKVNKLYGIDVVEYADSYADGLLHRYFCSSPYVVKLHVPLFTTEPINKSESKIVGVMEKKFAQKANKVISPSRKVAGLAENLYQLQSPVEVIPNPIDISQYSSVIYQGEEKNILIVGWISPVKGTDILMRSIPYVVEKYPDVKFKFIGDPVSSQFGHSMIELARKLKVENNVIWAGRFEHSQLPQLYKESTFCVIPSRWENFPYVCLEAFASGKTVVAMNIGGLSELVSDHDTGILVEPENPIALAEGIIELLDNPHLITEFSEKALMFVRRNYAIDNVVDRMLALYQSVISGTETA